MTKPHDPLNRCRKSHRKFQHPYRRNVTHYNKVYIKQTYSNIILNGKPAETFPVKVSSETEISTFYTLIMYFWNSSQSNKTRARNKRGSNKERSQIIPTDDMILNLKDPKNYTKKSLRKQKLFWQSI
jgi:hypothetical protein